MSSKVWCQDDIRRMSQRLSQLIIPRNPCCSGSVREPPFQGTPVISMTSSDNIQVFTLSQNEFALSALQRLIRFIESILWFPEPAAEDPTCQMPINVVIRETERNDTRWMGRHHDAETSSSLGRPRCQRHPKRTRDSVTSHVSLQVLGV